MGFEETQQKFMQYIRDPEASVAPDGLEERRLKIYKDLFFNNIKGFVSSACPVLESIYGDEKWEALIRQFFVIHDCRSPYFVDISKEFVEFLSNEYVTTESDPAFLQELAHYEWMELEMSVRKGEPEAITSQFQELVPIRLSRYAQLLSYQFPVHQISEDFQPQQPSQEPHYFIVHRSHNDEVNFTEINAVTAHLVNSVIQAETITLDSLITNMQNALSHLPEDQVAHATTDIVQQMFNTEIFVQQGVDDC